LNIAGLTLESPKTYFDEAVSIGRLRLGSNAEVVNRCGSKNHSDRLKINHLINSGSIVNEGILKADQITDSGKLSNCGDDAVMTAKRLQSSGEVINEGLLQASYINSSGKLHNRGIGQICGISQILGEYPLHSDGEVINDAIMHACKITGSGKLTNQHILKMIGTQHKAAIIGIREVVNQKGKLGQAMIEGINLHITGENQIFTNGKDTEFKAGRLLVDRSLVQGTQTSGSSFVNRGKIAINNECIINRDNVTNSQTFQARKLTLGGLKFTNTKFGDLKILEEFSCPSAALVNEGTIDSQGLFTKSQGQFTNSGVWRHDGDVHLGKTPVRNTGRMVWKNGTWTTDAREITYRNNGTWILKSMKSEESAKIILENGRGFEHTEGFRCLENSNITLQKP
jgi:hypothetical protein